MRYEDFIFFSNHSVLKSYSAELNSLWDLFENLDNYLEPFRTNKAINC